jgi:HlyD family secretion protein
MKKKIIPIVLILAAGGFGLYKYFNQADFLYAGTIEATEVDISPQVTGVLSKVAPQEGDLVKKDQVIIEIAGEDYKLAAQIADREYARAVKLHKTGSMPDEAFDRAGYKRDDTALRAQWCTINAPLDGVTLDRYHEPGELVNPSMKILTLADLSEVWVYVYVPQSHLATLSLGQIVTGFLPELGMKPFEGKIISIRNDAEFTPKNVQTRDERTRLVYGVKVQFKNSVRTLKPGMTIEVKLPE